MSELCKQAFNGNLKEVKRIIESDEFFRNDLWAVSCAIGNAKGVEIVKYLIDNGLPVQKYALNQAVNSGNLKIVKFFIERGYTPEEEDLDDAIISEYFDISNYLIDIDCPISGFAVDHAVSVGNTELVIRLMDKGAKTDNNCISQAISDNNIKMIAVLVSKGRKIRKSHLLEAIAIGNISTILFIKANLDDSAFDQTVLKAAIESERLALIKIFVTKIDICEDNISYVISNAYPFQIIEYLIDCMKRQENGSCISEEIINLADFDSESESGSDSGSDSESDSE